MNNKAVILSDIIVEKKLDILCLVETWPKQSDGLLLNELTPAGYGLFDVARSSGRGGGVGGGGGGGVVSLCCIINNTV